MQYQTHYIFIASESHYGIDFSFNVWENCIKWNPTHRFMQVCTHKSFLQHTFQ